MLKATFRRVRAVVVVIAVVLAATLVSVVTVDLGPSLRERAERAGGNWLERPMHIGRLGIHIARGEFVIEDLRIEGLTPEAPPWLVAKRIDVGLTWSALFHREVLVAQRRDGRLEDVGPELRQRPAQLAAAGRAATRAEHRASAGGHDHAVRARDARRIRVRRLRLALVGGRAEPRSHGRKSRRLSRPRTVHRRDDPLPGLPADDGEHVHELPRRGRQDRARPNRPRRPTVRCRSSRASWTLRAVPRCSIR